MHIPCRSASHLASHLAHHPRPARRGGFTLIELIVAMTIVTILASVALPAYFGHVTRARRAEARTQLMQVAQFMQRFYAANDSFEHDRAGNAVFDRIPASLKRSPESGDQLYALVIPPATLNDASFEVRMVPIAGASMGSDACGTFTLSAAGVRGVDAATGAANLRDMCWK